MTASQNTLTDDIITTLTDDIITDDIISDDIINDDIITLTDDITKHTN